MFLRETEEALRLLEAAGVAQAPSRGKNLGGIVVEREGILAVDLTGEDLELFACVLDATRASDVLERYRETIRGAWERFLGPDAT